MIAVWLVVIGLAVASLLIGLRALAPTPPPVAGTVLRPEHEAATGQTVWVAIAETDGSCNA